MRTTLITTMAVFAIASVSAEANCKTETQCLLEIQKQHAQLLIYEAAYKLDKAVAPKIKRAKKLIAKNERNLKRLKVDAKKFIAKESKPGSETRKSLAEVLTVGSDTLAIMADAEAGRSVFGKYLSQLESGNMTRLKGQYRAADGAAACADIGGRLPTIRELSEYNEREASVADGKDIQTESLNYYEDDSHCSLCEGLPDFVQFQAENSDGSEVTFCFKPVTTDLASALHGASELSYRLVASPLATDKENLYVIARDKKDTVTNADSEQQTVSRKQSLLLAKKDSLVEVICVEPAVEYE